MNFRGTAWKAIRLNFMRCVGANEALTRRMVRIAFIGALGAWLSGCSVNPVVQWAPTQDPPSSLGAALQDAQTLRAQFELRVEQQLDRKIMTNNLLFGLGVASFAAVASKAHRDVLAVTAGLGGATYLYSTTGLQQSVLDAYQVGIGRVNCAATIGRALQVDSKMIEAQASQTKDLRRWLPTLASAIARAEMKLLETRGIDDAYRKVAVDRIESAKRTLEKAQDVNKDADALNEREAGVAGKLLGTLHAIHQGVNEMASKGVAEPKAVLESLKSLAGIAGDFGKAVGATGSAPEATGTATGANLTPSAQGDPGTAGTQSGAAASAAKAGLSDALTRVADVQERVRVPADALQQRATRQVSTVDANDLDKCVPDTAKLSTFKVSSTALTFEPNKDDDQSQSFSVSGGTTNYTARFTSQPTFGISLTSPPAGGNVFEVKVPKSTKGPHVLTVVVEDSSAARNQASISVKVVAAPAKVDKAGNQSDSVQGSDLLKALASAKQNGASIFFGSGTGLSKLAIERIDPDAVGARVVLSCERSSNAATITNKDARDKLLNLLRDSFGLAPGVVESVRKAPAQLTLVSSSSCLK